MNTVDKTSKILGVAFLLQAVTSLSFGMILKQGWIVPGNIDESMINIANNALLMRTNIFGEMITAAGIIFLGSVLFVTLRKQNEKIALTALGLYILEAVMLAVSKMETFSLLRISQEYVAAGHPANLLTMGNLALESMNFGSTLAMVAFCLGAIPFYYLLDKSRIVPRALSLWGLITASLVTIWTVLAVFGHTVPFFLYFPYVPFEFVIGGWILVRGISEIKQ